MALKKVELGFLREGVEQPRCQLFLGDCLGPEGLAVLGDDAVDVGIHDPPYSEHVHKAQRRGGTDYPKDGARRGSICRNRDLGFEHLDPKDRQKLAAHYARITRRWTLVFSDTESSHLWRADLENAGLEYIRTLFWHKLGATPQFTGDRPAVCLEAITLMHRPGRKRWNGGGKHGFYDFPIVLNRGGADERCHPTQKPLDLMRALVADFTEPGELILDSHLGSGTTAVAALMLGRQAIGWERQPKHLSTARDRCRDALAQPSLFNQAPARPMEQLSL